MGTTVVEDSESLMEFFAMGGHGVYVWSAYALMLVFFLYLGWYPLHRLKRWIKANKPSSLDN